jgi:small subunit ribosomal protein S16
MAVRLRLRREGTHKRPHYRVVAADSRAPRDGRFIEIIGNYHPLEEPSRIEIDRDRALHWLQVGAQPSAQVEKLLRIQGIWEEFKPGDAPKRDRSAEDKKRLSKKAKARAEAAESEAPKAPEPAAKPADAAAPPEEPADAAAPPAEPADAASESAEEGDA